MPPGTPFLSIRLRAYALATEVEERILKAMIFASGTGDITVSGTKGHFGNSITVFEVELTRTAEMKRFLQSIRDSGIPEELIGQADRRTDDDCAFHFRLDKQKAYLEELALANGRDVIDVRMKVGAYPARRESAVKAVEHWLSKGRE